MYMVAVMASGIRIHDHCCVRRTDYTHISRGLGSTSPSGPAMSDATVRSALKISRVQRARPKRPGLAPPGSAPTTVKRRLRPRHHHGLEGNRRDAEPTRTRLHDH
jgi:hypothetical protein